MNENTQPPLPPQVWPTPTKKANEPGPITKKRVGIGVGIAFLAMAAVALASPGGQKGFEAGIADGLATPSPTLAPTEAPTPTAAPTPTSAPRTPTPTPTPRDLAAELAAALAANDCDALNALSLELIDMPVEQAAAYDDASDVLSASLDCYGIDDTSSDRSKIGQTISFGDDSGCEVDVTPTAVKAWKSNNMFVKPGKNKRFVTVLVTVKPTAGASDCYGIGYSYVGVESLDGYAYDSEPAWRDPQLPYDSDIAAKNGKAIKGWVTFELPKALKKGIVTYGDGEWAFTVK